MKVVYYCTRSGWSEKLRYSLRSLEKFFQVEVDVHILGEQPEWIQNVTHHPYEKGPFNQQLLDSLFTLNQEFSPHEDFIWMIDSLYLLKTLTIAELSRYYYSTEVSGVRGEDRTIRKKVFFDTMDLGKDFGYTQFNFDCNVPIIFNAGKLTSTFEQFQELKKLNALNNRNSAIKPQNNR